MIIEGKGTFAFCFTVRVAKLNSHGPNYILSRSDISLLEFMIDFLGEGGLNIEYTV